MLIFFFLAAVTTAQSDTAPEPVECVVLPDMVVVDMQLPMCCAAASTLIASGAIAKGLGSIIPSCLSIDMGGCEDGTFQPTEAALAEAAMISCCSQSQTGSPCHQSIVAGGGTGGGGMNGQVVGGFDADGDGSFDMCANVTCSGPSDEGDCTTSDISALGAAAACGEDLGCAAGAIGQASSACSTCSMSNMADPSVCWSDALGMAIAASMDPETCADCPGMLMFNGTCSLVPLLDDMDETHDYVYTNWEALYLGVGEVEVCACPAMRRLEETMEQSARRRLLTDSNSSNTTSSGTTTSPPDSGNTTSPPDSDTTSGPVTDTNTTSPVDTNTTTSENATEPGNGHNGQGPDVDCIVMSPPTLVVVEASMQFDELLTEEQQDGVCDAYTGTVATVFGVDADQVECEIEKVQGDTRRVLLALRRRLLSVEYVVTAEYAASPEQAEQVAVIDTQTIVTQATASVQEALPGITVTMTVQPVETNAPAPRPAEAPVVGTVITTLPPRDASTTTTAAAAAATTTTASTVQSTTTQPTATTGKPDNEIDFSAATPKTIFTLLVVTLAATFL